MPATPRLALPYPASSATPDVPRDIHALATALDHAAQFEQGLASAKPAFGVPGRVYWATDERAIYVDTGTAWEAATPFSVPVGGTIVWPATAAPSADWLIANGQSVSSVTYPALYAVYGTAYGGDGAPSFNVPDLRGRAPVGKGANAQVDALGKSDGLADAARKRAHKHAIATATAAGAYTGTAAAVGNHSHGGATGGADRALTHSHGTRAATSYTLGVGSGGSVDYVINGFGATADAAAPDHLHGINPDGGHSHSVSGSVSVGVTGSTGDQAGPADNEPFLVVNFAIRAK